MDSSDKGGKADPRPVAGTLGIVLAAAAALAVVWTTAAFFIAERRADVIDGSARILTSATTTFRQHAVQTFDAAELALRHTGETLEYIAPDELSEPARLTRLLARLQGASPFLKVIGLVGFDGRIIGDSRGTAAGQKVADRPHVKAILDDPKRSFYLGRVFRTRVSGMVSIPVSAPWRGSDGRLKGVITGLVDPNYFSDFYARALFGRRLSVVVAIPGNGPIAEFPENIAAASSGSRLPIPVTNGKAPTGVSHARSTVDGQEYLVAAATDDDPPIVVAVGETMAQIDARWRRSAWVVSGFSGALSALIVIAAILLRRKMRLRERLNTTLQRAADEQIRLADSKFHFLAQVSHELRTPLNAVIGFSSMIGGERLGPIGNPRYREYAHDIEQSGRYLLGVINDLLDFAKLDAGKFVLREEEFAVAEAVETVRVLMTPLARKGSIALRIEDSTSDTRLLGDLQIVKQMLVNVVANAIKFTPEHGEVALSACREANGALMFQVRDNGVGIAKEDIPRVLMPYEQSDAAGTRRERDTGLGLALTKKFADLHGARLDIDSAVGVGTAVTITFPKERVRVPEAARRAAKGAAA